MCLVNLPTKRLSSRLPIVKATAKSLQVDNKGYPRWNIWEKRQPTNSKFFATSDFLKNTTSPEFQNESLAK